VLEEVLDLLDRDLRQVGIVVDVLVAPGELGRGHGHDLLVAAGLVLHLEHAHRAHRHHRAGNDPALVGDQYVAGVAIVRQRVRDEAIIPRIVQARRQPAPRR